MRPEKQAVDAFRAWPLHQERGGLRRRRYYQRGVGLHNITSPHRGSLALADVYTKEDRCLCCLRHWAVVCLLRLCEGRA